MQLLEVLSRQRLTVGESPLWDEKKQALYTIDVRGKCIQQIDPAAGDLLRQIDLPTMVGSIALMEDGTLMVSLEDGIYRVEEDGRLQCLHAPQIIKGDMFNDGKVGPDGAFYVGTMAANFGGAFYRLTADGRLEELFDHVGCSNGIAWSRDEATMYYCDSSTQKLEAFDFDKETGTLSNRRTVCEVPGGVGEFDGMTIDRRDHLWVGVWDGGCLYEVDPAVGVVGTVKLPVSRGTCCTFTGSDLKTLVITSAAKEIDLVKEPLAGFTLKMEMPAEGRATYRFPNI